jgi:hypothetical protein
MLLSLQQLYASYIDGHDLRAQGLAVGGWADEAKCKEVLTFISNFFGDQARQSVAPPCPLED